MRLAVVGPSPCGKCTAVCCKQTITEHAVLLEGPDEERRFGPWSETFVLNGNQSRRVIPYRAGRCPFLGEDDRCTIYDDRPLHCRRFECTKFFDHRGQHGHFLRTNNDVLRLLKGWA
ncbi:MAG: YkgJ family cysteine cluster protein [Planctomycetota bacterium]